MNDMIAGIVRELRERHEYLVWSENFFREGGLHESARTRAIQRKEVENIANAVAIYLYLEGDGRLEDGKSLLHRRTETEVSTER